MVTQRRQRFINGLLAWVTTATFILVLLDTLTYELIFVVSFIGFLVITDLSAPFTITTRWQSRLRWLMLLGLLVFGYIVSRRILAILPSEVL